MEEQMKRGKKNTVFISYSHKDEIYAKQISAAIPKEFEVWIDKNEIKPGENISAAIQDGLSASDYYVLIISESSNKSSWVKREVSAAFELSIEKKLSVIPVLLDESEIPLEFKGLLTIDFRQSFSDGLARLREFFIGQVTTAASIQSGHAGLNKHVGLDKKRSFCIASLSKLPLGDLRHLVTDRLSIEDIQIVWFDLFNRRMSDEIKVENLALSCVQLIDKSRRMDMIADLLDKLCRNCPYISNEYK